jgi:hypothetical protein
MTHGAHETLGGEYGRNICSHAHWLCFCFRLLDVSALLKETLALDSKRSNYSESN